MCPGTRAGNREKENPFLELEGTVPAANLCVFRPVCLCVLIHHKVFFML